MSTVHTTPPRTPPGTAAAFGDAAVHEAQGRTGLMLPYLRPIYPSVREEKVVRNRPQVEAGRLGLNVYNMREALARKGLTYKPYGE